jgi:hypothetical protein
LQVHPSKYSPSIDQTGFAKTVLEILRNIITTINPGNNNLFLPNIYYLPFKNTKLNILSIKAKKYTKNLF